ncbi:MAG: ATP-dependent RNA helicase HrpA [Proteobacteria bacterium]|nr:ATP-dependent RNA helicase HrpA [Pseudomonadota bacterium]
MELRRFLFIPMSGDQKNHNQELHEEILLCLSQDQHGFRKQFNQLVAKKDNVDWSVDLEILRSKINVSVSKASIRKGRIPNIYFGDKLPVVERREEIKRLISQHQVVILCGETGSGKTTQLPKMLLEIGRGVCGQIAHTQPRRIAARLVASRVAKELQSEIGDLVGYQIRFSDRSSPKNLIKVMTDGVLLAETQTDRYLSQYDTIIIDEAHERNLNVDFLFGYLKRLLKNRPDLKLIITSATIDADKFSSHFGQAPVIEVSGRLYPVEIRYQPPGDEGVLEDAENLYDALCQVMEEIDVAQGGGDVLVFLPGEREIRQSLEWISKHFLSKLRRSKWEALPLYSRLSIQDQNRIFTPSYSRRVILATNIAETSLTIPKIQYVIDSGLARVKRYSYRNKVEMLQVEKVSQASANQRAGRSGRVMNGVCVRLYSESDFDQRLVHAEPEILRSSLASVILRMSVFGLESPDKFPFIDPPTPKALADGYQLLEELGAIDQKRQLTAIGKKIAHIPVDPRVARMILASNELGCLDEVLKLAAGLSVQDPRERDFNSSEAPTLHGSKENKSDFSSLLEVWNWFRDIFEKKLGKKQLKELCRCRHLSLVRMFEWRELYHQLKSMSIEMGFKINDQPSKRSEIHRALLTGLLGNLGFRGDEKGVYYGARGIKFHIHPSSDLRSAKPKWIIASELVETSRLYARCVAEIDVEWVEPVAKHLTHSTYHEPRWSKNIGNVIATERVTLYGLVIVPQRQSSYGPINIREAREIFIRGALVKGEVKSPPSFLKHNLDLIESLQSVEARSRRYDLLVDDSVVYSFFEKKIPENICSWVDFEKWRKPVEAKEPRCLHLTKALLVRKDIESETFELYPDVVTMNGYAFRLEYRFEPGHIFDGVTVKVPIEMLNKIDQVRIEWLVPGLIREKVTAVIKGLPKSIRKKIFPIKQFVDEIVGDLNPKSISLFDLIIKVINASCGELITREVVNENELPDYLRMNFSVVDEVGVDLDSGRDLAELRKQFGLKATETFTTQTTKEFNKVGLKTWNFGNLPEVIEMSIQDKTVVGFPCLKDEKDSVSIILTDTEIEADFVSKRGVQRLFQLTMKEQFKFISNRWNELPQMSLQYSMLLNETGVSSGGALVQRRLIDELMSATSARAIFFDGEMIRTERAFSEAAQKAKSRIFVIANEINQIVVAIFQLYAKVRVSLSSEKFLASKDFVQNIKNHLDSLMPPDFIANTPYIYLKHFPRYLEAICSRIEKIRSDPSRDASWQSQISIFEEQIARSIELSVSSRQRQKLIEVRWSLEELRVSLWAQQLKTLYPVSFKRIERSIVESLV